MTGVGQASAVLANSGGVAIPTVARPELELQAQAGWREESVFLPVVLWPSSVCPSRGVDRGVCGGGNRAVTTESNGRHSSSASSLAMSQTRLSGCRPSSSVQDVGLKLENVGLSLEG
eukprot:3149176-Rhodomonas_salina.3